MHTCVLIYWVQTENRAPSTEDYSTHDADSLPLAVTLTNQRLLVHRRQHTAYLGEQ